MVLGDLSVCRKLCLQRGKIRWGKGDDYGFGPERHDHAARVAAVGVTGGE
jgi:hypothetical protein